MKQKLHFAHGNGFPSLCYRQFLQALETRFDCAFIDKVGHDPDYPVDDNWSSLVDELIASVRASFSEPVVGLGHSLGGVLTLLAALREPSLFHTVIMIDSPLLNRFRSRAVLLAKHLGLIDKLTPAGRTRWRKHRWESREELLAYLRSRPLFQTFTEACLQDYVEYGVIWVDGACELAFDRDIEYRIFRTIPHHLPSLEQRLPIPTSLVYGDNSTVVDKRSVRYMKDKYGVESYKLPGTHMLPMEIPQRLAEEVFRIVGYN